MMDIFEMIKDLKQISQVLEDEDTTMDPQTIFAKFKVRELIIKYEDKITDYERSFGSDTTKTQVNQQLKGA